MVGREWWQRAWVGPLLPEAAEAAAQVDFLWAWVPLGEWLWRGLPSPSAAPSKGPLWVYGLLLNTVAAE